MKLIFIQALKDIRLLRWLLAAWALALVVAHGALLYSARLTTDAAAGSFVTSASFQTTIGMIGAAILILIAALLVQHDSPVSANAFWLTRPTPPGAMLASKLLVAFVVLALLPAIAEAVDYVVAGVGVQWLPPHRVPLQLAWFLPVMAVAAVAADVPQFVLVALVEFVLLLASEGLAAAFGLRPAINWHFDVFLAVMALASACVLAWQYLTRRRTAAAIFLAIAPFAITLGLDLWPWAKPTIELYPEERRKAISIVADRAAMTSVMRIGDRVFQIPLTISGEPANTFVRTMPESVRIWLQQKGVPTPFEFRPGRTYLASPEVIAKDLPLTPDDPRARDVARRFESALAGTALMNPHRAAATLRPAITFFAMKDDVPRLAGAVGTLHIEFDMEAQEWGVCPGVRAVAGARYDGPAQRGTIDAVTTSRDAIWLELREAGSGWYPREWFSATCLLRNRAAGQALLPSPSSDRVRTNYGEPGMVMPLAESLVLRWYSKLFDNWQPTGDRRSMQLFGSDDEARRWLKDVELVIVPYRRAGQFHVVLELPDFVIDKRP